MSRSYATRTNNRSRGLWPLVAEPGPSFRWGLLLRRSKYTVTPDGVKFEESTDRQELELITHIQSTNKGVIVEVYKDIASAYRPVGGLFKPVPRIASTTISASHSVLTAPFQA